MFKKEAFLKSNEAGGGDFNVPTGVYIATLERAEFKESKQPDSKSRGASFGWQISDEDPTAPNLYVWDNIWIIGREGATNEIGMNQFSQMLYKLAEGQFDPDEFEFNSEGVCINEDEVLDKFVGTKVRLSYKNKGKNADGYDDTSIKITRILENVYAGNGQVTPTDEIDSPPFDGTVVTEEKSVTIAIGDAVIFEHKGSQCRGRVANYIDGAEPGKGMVSIKETVGNDDTFLKYKDNDALMLSEEGVFVVGDIPNLTKLDLPDNKRQVKQNETIVIEPVPEEEEILDEEVALVLQKDGTAIYNYEGKQVSIYNYEGKQVSSKIHAVNEEEGWIKVVVTKDNRKVARKIQISDVVSATPF
jgi:hypothetical protein